MAHVQWTHVSSSDWFWCQYWPHSEHYPLNLIEELYSQHPDKAPVQLRVYALQVVEHDGFPQQLFVEGQREAAVQVVTVEDRDPDDAAHEVKVRQVLLQKGTCVTASANELRISQSAAAP